MGAEFSFRSNNKPPNPATDPATDLVFLSQLSQMGYVEQIHHWEKLDRYGEKSPHPKEFQMSPHDRGGEI